MTNVFFPVLGQYKNGNVQFNEKKKEYYLKYKNRNIYAILDFTKDG